jgi:hypothetical protein
MLREHILSHNNETHDNLSQYHSTKLYLWEVELYNLKYVLLQ